MSRVRNRGVTAVVGLSLLIGIVAVGSVTVLVIGNDIQESGQQRIDDTRIETSFIQLDERIMSVSRDKNARASVDFDLANSAADDTAIRRESTGTIVVNRTNLTDTTTVAVKDIGSVVYTRDDTQYTYQAGAVWRNSGNATELVSAPQLSYEFSTGNGRARPTLSLDVPELSGDDRIGSGEVSVAHNNTIAPFNNVSTVDNELITMSVTSEFYVGWGEYFEERYPGVTTVAYDHPNDTVTIEFGKQEIDGEFDAAIKAGSNVGASTGSPTITGPVETDTTSGNVSCGGNVTCNDPATGTELDTVIQSKISESKSKYPDSAGDIESGTTLTAGEYYASGFYLDKNDLTIDLADGNVTLVVDGPVAVANQITVKNADQNATCCYARVYVGDSDGSDGDMAFGTGSAAVEVESTSNSSRFQVYGTSEMQFNVGQANNPGIDAVVYAPHEDPATGSNGAYSEYGLGGNFKCGKKGGKGGKSGDPDACFGKGNGGFSGALIGFQDVALSQSADVSFDPSVTKADPTLAYTGTVPPPITFLQVSVHEVCVGEGSATC